MTTKRNAKYHLVKSYDIYSFKRKNNHMIFTALGLMANFRATVDDGTVLVVKISKLKARFSLFLSLDSLYPLVTKLQLFFWFISVEGP